jgi:parallel beta-helix repeat protein
MRRNKVRRKTGILKKYFFCVSILLFFLNAAAAAATNFHVPADYPKIQGAINAASSGDTVLIADGEYLEWTIDFKGKAISIQSVNGPQRCIINCRGNGSGFYFHSREGMNSRISGVTITNGLSVNGGGIICRNSSPTIENCIITGNRANPFMLLGGLGGGIYLESANPRIKRCILKENEAKIGAGIYARSSSSPKITNCEISRNSSSGFGAGLAFYSSSKALVFNSTIIDNLSGGNGGGLYSYGGAELSLTNCILWGNSPNQVYKGFFSGIYITYSDVDGGYSGIGNRSEDPLFLDPAHADYTLLASSPCRDTGTSNGAPAVDLNGVERPRDAGFDLGAYEYTSPDLLLEGLLAGGAYYSDTNIIVLNNSSIQNGHHVSLSANLNTIIKAGFRLSPGGRLTINNIDDDGLSNAWEIENLGHLDQGPDDNPDGDWMINYWEFVFGFDPQHDDRESGRNDDHDNDGFSNYIESVFGSDPSITADKPDLPGPGALYAYDALGRIKSIMRVK